MKTKKAKDVIVQTTGYGVAVRRANDHSVFDLHPRCYGRRKDLLAAFPHIVHDKAAYRVMRVDITKWVPR